MADSVERILRARAGDERALEDLIREHQQRVAGFMAARVADRPAIEDLCQTVFVKMVLSLPRLRAAEAFEPWLLRIAENVCRDHQRRERWRRRLFVRYEEGRAAGRSMAEMAAGPAEADEAEANEASDETAASQAGTALGELELARSGLGQMGAGQRQILALSLEKPRSYEELAALTKLSVSAVKSRLFRARARLRRLVTHRG